jgi:prevent-host-death family protein
MDRIYARIYGAAEFKSRCLRIMDEVAKTGHEVKVGKRGKPLVRVVPDTVAEPDPAYGLLKGTAVLRDDLFETGEQWDAGQD